MAKMAAWFLKIFTTLSLFFAKFVTRKFAILLSASTVLISMTVAVFTALHGAISGIASSITNPYILMGFGAVWPANADACLSVYFSARVTVWAYNFNKDLLQTYLGAI